MLAGKSIEDLNPMEIRKALWDPAPDLQLGRLVSEHKLPTPRQFLGTTNQSNGAAFGFSINDAAFKALSLIHI